MGDLQNLHGLENKQTDNPSEIEDNGGKDQPAEKLIGSVQQNGFLRAGFLFVRGVCERMPMVFA